MGAVRTHGLSAGVALRLGRVSNLPTVWTNVAAGAALAGAATSAPLVVVLAIAFSLFYVGGMFLNDAFDRDIDARERPERPIPSGIVSARTVFAAGFALLAAGWLLLVASGFLPADGTRWRGPVAGVLLAGAIVLYDAWHKGNPASPLLMGLCRLLVYLGAGAAAAAALPAPLVLAALVALSYLIGLTYAAKHESAGAMRRWWPMAFLLVPVGYAAWAAFHGPAALAFSLLFSAWLLHALSLLRGARRNVPRAVASLIAGLALLDAVFLAGAGHPLAALGAGACFLLTLALQRRIPGT